MRRPREKVKKERKIANNNEVMTSVWEQNMGKLAENC
jgi:hypothetical protein